MIILPEQGGEAESACNAAQGAAPATDGSIGDTSSMTTSVAVQSKEGVQCFTDGCTGQVKLAQELEVEAGIDTHRRELLRLSEQAKKAERPQQQQDQPEQRRGRKKSAVQRVPEIPGNTHACMTLPAEWA